MPIAHGACANNVFFMYRNVFHATNLVVLFINQKKLFDKHNILLISLFNKYLFCLIKW